jgi:dihydropteroate synthase
MAVLNLTPDSFFDRVADLSSIDSTLSRVEQMLPYCDILDLGSVSSRPGAIIPGIQEELDRLLPHLEAITKCFPELPVSVDTFRSSVAKAAITSGAAMINDISGGEMDPEMFETIASLRVPYVMMHMKGTPETMQKAPFYGDLLKEMMLYFSSKINHLRKLGLSDLIIDPGFGFGKSINDNYFILKHLEDFRIFELPILVGFSRKSMIQKVLGVTASEALNGTTILNTIAVQKGANILRVHDPKEAREISLLTKKTGSV